MNKASEVQLEGLIVLNKSKGYTSFQELSRLKKVLNVKKVGHAGTLDKEAEGILLVALGKSTKLLKFLVGVDKVYEAEFTFGEQRNTDDSNGVITEKYDGLINLDGIETIINTYRGEITQTPPDYSAVHVNGVRAYKISLNGKKPSIKPRKVNIYSFDILKKEKTVMKFRIHCSSGTYIRSLARDIGIQSGYFAYLSSLKRISVGKFNESDSYTIEDIQKNKFKIQKPASIINDLPILVIKEEYTDYIKNGKKLNKDFFITNIELDGTYVVQSIKEELLSIILISQNDFSYDLVY